MNIKLTSNVSVVHALGVRNQESVRSRGVGLALVAQNERIPQARRRQAVDIVAMRQHFGFTMVPARVSWRGQSWCAQKTCDGDQFAFRGGVWTVRRT